MASSLIVYGDALIDVTALIKSLPNQGHDIISDSIVVVPGGSAAIAP
jgi:sugar/nucleoside kinase (ribokinase family)